MTLLNLILKQSQQKLKLAIINHFLVTSIYRPLGKPVAYFHVIELLIRDIDSQNIESTIMGDSPIVISWINLTMIQKNLLKIMNTYNLKQVITQG